MTTYWIGEGGAGGFLNPPGHPAHTKHITNAHRDSISIESKYEWLPVSIMKQCDDLVAKWNETKPSLKDGEGLAWVHKVLGYFNHCYKGVGEHCWHADQLKVDHDDELAPMQHIDDHAGVHFIRKYYPDFTPTRDHFKYARWGK